MWWGAVVEAGRGVGRLTHTYNGTQAKALLEAMYKQANEKEGFGGKVTLSQALIEYIVDEELSYDTVTGT